MQNFLVVEDKKKHKKIDPKPFIIRLSPSYANSINELRCKTICDATSNQPANYHVLNPLYTIHDADYWGLLETLKVTNTDKELSTTEKIDSWCRRFTGHLAKKNAQKLKKLSDAIIPTGFPYFERKCDLFEENSAISLISRLTAAKSWLNPFTAIANFQSTGIYGNSRDDLYCSCETPAWAFSLTEKQLLPICSNNALMFALSDQLRVAIGELSFMPYCNLIFLAYFNQSEADNPNRIKKKLLDDDGNIVDGTYIMDFKKMGEFSNEKANQAEDGLNCEDLEKLTKIRHLKKLSFSVITMSLNTSILPNLMESNRMLKDFVTKNNDSINLIDEEPFQTQNPSLRNLGIRYPEDVANYFTEIFVLGVMLAFRREVEIAYRTFTDEVDKILFKNETQDDLLKPEHIRPDALKLANIVMDMMKQENKKQGDDEDVDHLTYLKDGLASIFHYLLDDCTHIPKNDDSNDKQSESDDDYVSDQFNIILGKLAKSFHRSTVEEQTEKIAKARAAYEKRYLESFSDIVCIIQFIVFLSEKLPNVVYEFVSGYIQTYYIDILSALTTRESGSSILSGLESHGDVKLCVAMGLLPKLYHPPLSEIKKLLDTKFPDVLRYGFQKTENNKYSFNCDHTDKVVNMAPWNDFYRDDHVIASKGRVPDTTDDDTLMRKKNDDIDSPQYFFSKYQFNNCFINLEFSKDQPESKERTAYRCRFQSMDYLYFSNTLHLIAYHTMSKGLPKLTNTLSDRIESTYSELFERHKTSYAAYLKSLKNQDKDVARTIKDRYDLDNLYSLYVESKDSITGDKIDDDELYEEFCKNPNVKLLLELININYFEAYWSDATTKLTNDEEALRAFTKDSDLPQGKVLRLMIKYVIEPIRDNLKEQMEVMSLISLSKQQKMLVPYMGRNYYRFLKTQSWLGVLFYDMLGLDKDDTNSSESPNTIIMWSLYNLSRLYSKRIKDFDIYKWMEDFNDFIRGTIYKHVDSGINK